MNKSLLALTAIAAIAASPAWAAPPKHHGLRTAPGYDSSNAYRPAYADVVLDGNRVIGQDPDLNIRAQLRRDSAVADD